MFTSVLLKDYRIANIPAGLIVPYNGTTAPDGWTLFTSADGRFLIGAGNTYAVGASGGSLSVTTGGSNNQGAHDGTGSAAGKDDPTTTYRGTNTAGSHLHILTYNYTPPYYGLRLIKANTDLYKLPAKTVMFSDATLGALTRFSSGDGKLFSPRSAAGSGGTNTIAGFVSSDSGNHAHGTSGGYTAPGSGLYGVTQQGVHTHPNANFTITPNLYRVLLSAWTDVSSAFNLQSGMYAFWQSTTPPAGWYLCNGSNGTLDLRDYFVEFTDEEDDGTRTGNGTITVPDITLSSVSNSHKHYGTGDTYSKPSYHGTYSNTHSHTIPGATPTFLPPYYALAIIQLAA